MIPNLRVEIAFNAGFLTDPAARVWTNVSAYVDGTEGIALTYGRDDELSTASPNTAELTLDNRDGRFTPGKTDGAYYPNVKIGRPIRITAIYDAVESVRFVGHINEWPVVWPTGGTEACSVTISAASIRARLGQTAPLTSAIRAAYLATNPTAYWPLDETADTAHSLEAQQIFFDLTNVYVPGGIKEILASFYETPALLPVTGDGTPGPTDESSLVYLPRFTNPSLIGTFPHYVGAGNTVSLKPVNGLTFEAVARVEKADPTAVTLTTIFDIRSSDLRCSIVCFVSSDGDPILSQVGAEIMFRDTATNLIVEDHSTGDPNDWSTYSPAAFAAATDGEIHHYAVTLSPDGRTAKFYFDGALLHTLTMTAAGTAFTQPFTAITLGTDAYNAGLWVGHVAAHQRVLTSTEVASHAAAATAASETSAERVTRLAGRVGLSPTLVSVEATVAAPLGSQPEAERSAIEVIEELADGTGGILFDSRAGALTMQARNHRYNAPLAFTLSTAADEIEADLAMVANDRYLANRLEVTRLGADNPIVRTNDPSITDYGVYTRTMTVVSTDDSEAESAAYNALRRFAQPTPRIAQVTVDLADLSVAQRTAVLQAEVGTQMALAGLPSQVQGQGLRLFIEGWSESISTAGHAMTMNTTPAEVVTGWVLGDSVLSVLGQTTLPVY